VVRFETSNYLFDLLNLRESQRLTQPEASKKDDKEFMWAYLMPHLNWKYALGRQIRFCPCNRATAPGRIRKKGKVPCNGGLKLTFGSTAVLELPLIAF
jgi:hypothetical protein